MRTQKEIDKLFGECLKEVISCGIMIWKVSGNVILAKRDTKRHACYDTSNGDITISKHLLDDVVPEKKLKQTICHEILHGCCGAVGHNAVWESYADKMNRTYGYNIKRCSSYSEFGLVSPESKGPFKYEIICPDCGEIVGKRKRESRLILHPEYFHHKGCVNHIEVRKIV